MECTNSARQRQTACTENRCHRSGTLSVQHRHCSSSRNATSWRMSIGGGRWRLQVLLHRTPRRPAKTSWCRLCNQNDITVTHGVTAAQYFTTYYDDAPSAWTWSQHGPHFCLRTNIARSGWWQGSLLRLSWLHTRSVPFRHRLLLLGDFGARVGRHTVAWPKVLGRHSVGRENYNGTLLLETCAKYQLVTT